MINFMDATIAKLDDRSADANPAADQLTFRNGMSRVVAAVHVVTTDGPGGRAGFTATAVTAVSDSPATLLVCLNRTGRTASVLDRNGVFCVNALAGDDQQLADVFAGRASLSGEIRFLHGLWESLATGAPALTSALVSFDCRILDLRPVATHQVLIGSVEAVRLGTDRPALVYVDRHYRRI